MERNLIKKIYVFAAVFHFLQKENNECTCMDESFVLS